MSAAVDDAAPTVDTQAALDHAVAGDTTELIALLRRPHADVRDGLGPHRLEAATDLTLIPSTPPPELPELDARFARPMQVHDELDLVWLPPSEDLPRFALSQSNEHDRGREVVAIDGQVHTRLPGRAWVVRPLETDLHELWLDDAYRSVGDALELAGPKLVVTRGEDRSVGSRTGAVLTLALGSPTTAPPLPPHPRAAWRAGAKISAITGEVVIDLATGAWLNADLSVGFSAKGKHGVPLSGELRIRAGLAPDEEGLKVQAPEDAVPYPERLRLDLERDELLDDLATH